MYKFDPVHLATQEDRFDNLHTFLFQFILLILFNCKRSCGVRIILLL